MQCPPEFGIGHLNLVQAGQLVAACLLLRGDLTAKVPPKDAYRFDDKDLIAPLKKHAAGYTAQLEAAVQSGSLAASCACFGIDDKIRPETTYVNAITMAAWLEERGVQLGAPFLEYLEAEDTVRRQVTQAVRLARLMAKGEKTSDSAKLTLLKLENERLLLELAEAHRPSRAHAPISEKQRGGFLNIIGALVGLLLGHAPNGKPYSQFQTQQAIIDAIHGNYGEHAGLSQRNLEDKFAEGKRTLIGTTNRL